MSLATLGPFADPRETVRIARAAEEAGWAALLVWDHLAWSSFGAPSADPWVTLGACAASTSRLLLGTAVTITPERPAAAAARTMLDHGVRRLPVVRDGALVGIVTRADLVRAFTRADAEIGLEIRDDVLRRALWLEPDAVEVAVDGGEVVLTGEIEARSDAEVLTKLVQRIPGVVSVRSNVLYRIDDLQRSTGGGLLTVR